MSGDCIVKNRYRAVCAVKQTGILCILPQFSTTPAGEIGQQGQDLESSIYSTVYLFTPFPLPEKQTREEIEKYILNNWNCKREKQSFEFRQKDDICAERHGPCLFFKSLWSHCLFFLLIPLSACLFFSSVVTLFVF